MRTIYFTFYTLARDAAQERANHHAKEYRVYFNPANNRYCYAPADTPVPEDWESIIDILPDPEEVLTRPITYLTFAAAQDAAEEKADQHGRAYRIYAMPRPKTDTYRYAIAPMGSTVPAAWTAVCDVPPKTEEPFPTLKSLPGGFGGAS